VSPSGDASSRSATTPTPVVAASTAPPRVTKALTIILENHGIAQAVNEMPKLMQFARRYGYAKHYQALTHDSLPNYIALAAGSTRGVVDDAPPAAHHLRGPSVFDQALAGGRTAKTYAEGMPTRCATDDAGSYAVRHNPWTYFADAASRRACNMYDVPLGTTSSGALHRDITQGTLPTVGLIVPDLCHDAHDCALSVADNWVAAWTRQVLAGPDWRSGHLALVVTFDETEGSTSDNTVLTVVAAPTMRARISTESYTHYSWTRWMSNLAGRAPLGHAATARSLAHGFLP
jgi:phospholipase C